MNTRFPTRIHRLELGTRSIDLLAPVNPDVLLDDPEVRKRYHADNYMPYWPIIWPSGLMLAAKVLSDQTSPPALPPKPPAEPGAKECSLNRKSKTENRKCIDLGCGLGITGIAAALRGWHVTFTDYDHEAVQFAAHNAARNGVPEHLIRPQFMDWRNPLSEKFPWVLASDVLYERRLHPLLLHAVSCLLAADGIAWISDPQRTSAEDFPLAAVEAGFKVQTENLSPPPSPSFSGGVQNGHLYILTRPCVK
ncbi:MAG: protein N-lysine methyltransferase family protein [Phycisphaerales bacterium]|nr:protein N-lysine methyltransferase family protein [Phycisphaerales bacterium]